MCSFVYSFFGFFLSFVRSSFRSFVRPSVRLLVRLFVRSLVRSFIRLFLVSSFVVSFFPQDHSFLWSVDHSVSGLERDEMACYFDCLWYNNIISVRKVNVYLFQAVNEV